MSRLYFKASERTDLLRIDMKAYERAAFRANPALWDTLLAGTGALTLFQEEEIIAILTWREVASGVCEISLLPSVRIDDCRVSAARIIRAAVRANTAKYRRVQATTLDSDLYRRSMRFLGMAEEGRMVKYMPDGSDLLIWGRVKWD
jgi:hypothetical protein